MSNSKENYSIESFYMMHPNSRITTNDEEMQVVLGLLETSSHQMKHMRPFLEKSTKDISQVKLPYKVAIAERGRFMRTRSTI